MDSSVNNVLPILIVGGGVSGLALAQGLRQHSIPVRVFERQPKGRRSQGHRFRIWGEAAQQALESVLPPDLRDLLKRTMAEKHVAKSQRLNPEVFEYEAMLPPDEPLSFPLDRPWLLSLLSLGLEDVIEYEKSFVSYTHETWGVRVTFSDGTLSDGRLLVGADGLHSRVRKQLQPGRKTLDAERLITWGRTPLTPSLKARLTTAALKTTMLSGLMDRKQNIVSILDLMVWTKSIALESGGRLPDIAPYFYWAVGSPVMEESPRTIDECQDFVRRVTENWHEDLKAIFGGASHELTVCTRVLSSKPDLELKAADHRGQVMLIGDAAHWMSPMAGAGGATSIRDAADLAKTVHEEGVNTESISGFVERMEERAKPVIIEALENGARLWGGKQLHEFEEVEIQ